MLFLFKKGEIIVMLLNHLKNETNFAYTENNAKVYNTTGSSLLDFFALGGALRNTSENKIITLFDKALAENKLLAVKAMFYFRDIRGGQGERETFRKLLKYLAYKHPDVVRKNIHLIPEYGRWDDIYTLFDTSLMNDALNLIKEQLKRDINSDSPSLLAKWLKSENASSLNSRILAKKTRMGLGMSSRRYRKMLSKLREKLNIVERLMSANKWDEIDYSQVPSQASLKYNKAFWRNDEDRYTRFLQDLKEGKVKVNSKTVFPYELVGQVFYYSEENADLLNEMWESLPDYLEGKKENSIAVVDVSGSMTGTPMDIAISVGLYLAERNKGAFHNHFITFSEYPQLVEIKGTDFCSKVRNIEDADWGVNTNLEKVFDLILNTALKNNVPQSEMPTRLFIISDMQFDEATGKDENDAYFFNTIKNKFEVAGYKMPKLVFWNVDVRDNIMFPMIENDNGLLLVSGASPSIFTNIMKDNIVTPHDIMMDVLNSERYSLIQV